MTDDQFVSVPAGPFTMGTSQHQVDLLCQADALARKWRDKGYFQREQPQHEAKTEACGLGRYPVTVGEYLAFVEDDGYRFRDFWTDPGWRWRSTANRSQPGQWRAQIRSGLDMPVTWVSYFEAEAFCRWLSQQSGDSCQLPTEAHWEKGARGGDGRLYPWGNQFDPALCNAPGRGGGKLRPVTLAPELGQSPYGCLDMVGNVSEWTRTILRPYPYRGDDGRNDPEADGVRVLRGGSWVQPVLRARTAVRGMNDPDFTDDDVGFRVARLC